MSLEDMVIKVGPDWRAPLPRQPEQPRFPQQWATEKEARDALEQVLSPYGFILVPEVRLREPGKPHQRIDYVALCPEHWPIQIFGIEVKRGFPKLMHLLDVVEQAKRYRYAVLDDPRLPFVAGERLPYVFVWPSLNALDDCEHRSGSRAIRIMAGRSNIGSIDISFDSVQDWRGYVLEWEQCLTFRLGQEYVWTDRYYGGDGGRFGLGSKFAGTPLRGLRNPE